MKVKSKMDKLGIQLVFRPTSDGYEDDEFYHFDNLNWGLSDYSFFGSDTSSGDWYVESADFIDLYENCLKEFIDPIAINKISEYLQNTNYDRLYDKKIQIPIIVDAWWESSVDWESGVDEGSYEFQFDKILDL